MTKILFVTSEAHPLIKTGGLADVCGSLPKALADLHQDIRLIMPNYNALKTNGHVRYVCSIRVDNREVNILETQLPDSNVLVWLVDCAEFFNLPGNPYTDENGEPWANNAVRFALLCRVAVECAMNRIHQDWQPDIVHCNDWQTGLVPALLSLEANYPASVFTIHNLAYQGLFPSHTVAELHLPGQLWHADGLEFNDMLSFIKGGLVYANKITTVSPTYALEIQTPEFGYGLEGLLTYRQEDLIGIINGIDMEQWNPELDSLINPNFNAATLNKKQLNKTKLQKKLALPVDAQIPMIALISRLVEQKGIDMVIACLPEIMTHAVQFVLLGAGDKIFEQALQGFADSYPDKIAIIIGYDEALAHVIEASADIFLMPSRFEPCGLNQMYSQRYGTIPIVRKTGGLADTVIDASPETITQGTATGIVFNDANAGSMMEAVKRALLLYTLPTAWHRMQMDGMQKDFSWQRSAENYLQLYQSI